MKNGSTGPYENHPIRQDSIAYRILQYVRAKKVCSFYDVAYGDRSHGSDYKRWAKMDRKNIASLLNQLTKSQFLSRSAWTTPKGRVYCPKGKESLIIPYMLENKLIPATTPLFLKLIRERRAISSIELRHEGIDGTDIAFFSQKLVKESRLIKITKVDTYLLFYLNEDDVDIWKRIYLKNVKLLEVKDWKSRQEKGKTLEDKIERFYQRLGFITERNRWFTTPITHEKLEIDILCRLPMLPDSFEHRKELIIAVQCKAWQTGFRKEHFLTGNIVLNWSSKVKEVFPNAICDFWAFHMSNVLFKKSILYNNPSIRLFSSKEIDYAFKSTAENNKIVVEPLLKNDDVAH